MTKQFTDIPVENSETSSSSPSALGSWQPFGALRHEIDQVIEKVEKSLACSPFDQPNVNMAPIWRRELAWSSLPLVYILEQEDAYEFSAEAPELIGKDISFKLDDNILVIREKKQKETVQTGNVYSLEERRSGASERRICIPEGVDTDKIEAFVLDGMLTIRFPKN